DEAGQSPLHVEAERQQGADSDQRGDGRQIADHAPAIPRGRASSTSRMIPNPTADLYVGGITIVLSSSVTPTIRAPRSAPGAEPLPPRIAAAKTAMIRLAPSNGSIVVSRPRKTPAPPDSAPPPRAAMPTMRSVGRPLTRASRGLSAVARMPIPSRVRLRNTPTRGINTPA